MTHHLQSPSIEWRDGAPFDRAYGDIFFNPADGLAETSHVFLGGNNLPQAWGGARRFTIGELGFGTGLNFLATWDLWRRNTPAAGHLFFISIEGAPMGADQLRDCHAAFPALDPLAAQLRAEWPGPVRGIHHLALTPDVTLILLLGDADEMLPQLHAKVDAWFLDGFSPAKNDAMWSAGLMAELSRCSHFGSTLATYTAAGGVREALTNAGFEVARGQGYGRKKHMVTGTCRTPPQDKSPPWFAPAPSLNPTRIAVIGAGIAGLSAGAALACRGKSVMLIDAASGPAMGASGTPSGLIMPRLVADRDPAARFSAAAFRYAAAFYRNAGLLDARGGLHLATTAQEAQRFDYVADSGFFARDELEIFAPTRLEAELGEPSTLTGLLAEGGGALRGPVTDAFDLSKIECLWQTKIEALTLQDAKWHLQINGKSLPPFDAVVVATGMETLRFIDGFERHLIPSEGHIVRVTGAAPARPVTFGDYASPVSDGAWLGATHEGPDQLLSADQATETILASLGRLLPTASKSWRVTETWQGMRATTPDRLPIAGAVPDAARFLEAFDGLKHGAIYTKPDVPYLPGLYTITGLGSRGLTTGPYLGEMLAAQICDEPWPVACDVMEALHPARFWVRDLIKGRLA